MSLKYEIVNRAVRMAGLKNRSGKTAEEILKIKTAENRRNRIPQLHDPAMIIDLIQIDGFPVMRMIHRQKTDRATLFIIGGGMVTPPRPGSIRKALKSAKQTGCDVYVPYYPLCTEYPVTRAYQMIHSTYLKMLQNYSPENISVLGTSSGGNLALGIIPYINAEHPEVPKPAYILAISPGTCVSSEEERKALEALDEKDVAISAEYMFTAEEILRHGETDIPEYMIFLQKGDFTYDGKITLIYGSDECLYGFEPSFERAFAKYHARYDLIVGEGMFHCWPVFPVVKEARQGWDLMIRLIRTHGRREEE